MCTIYYIATQYSLKCTLQQKKCLQYIKKSIHKKIFYIHKKTLRTRNDVVYGQMF
jgi:hypothetical protein